MHVTGTFWTLFKEDVSQDRRQTQHSSRQPQVSFSDETESTAAVVNTAQMNQHRCRRHDFCVARVSSWTRTCPLDRILTLYVWIWPAYGVPRNSIVFRYRQGSNGFSNAKHSSVMLRVDSGCQLTLYDLVSSSVQLYSSRQWLIIVRIFLTILHESVRTRRRWNRPLFKNARDIRFEFVTSVPAEMTL